MARRRSAARDDELRRVFRDHVEAVYAHFAYSVDAATAEDLTSATFEKVLRSWKRYDASKASERTWILSHCPQHADRPLPPGVAPRRRVARRASSVPRDASPDSTDFVGRTLDADELRSWLSVLGDREREILGLRYGADLAGGRHRGVVGLSAANVHQILSRSLRRLRDHAGAAERG